MNIHADYREEFTSNLMLLKKCNRTYNWLIIAYFFLLAIFPLVSLMMLLATVISNDSIFLVIDSILTTPLLYYCAYKAVYQKRDLPAVGIPAVLLVNQIILGIARHHLTGKFINGRWTFKAVSYVFGIHLVLLIIAAVFAFINYTTNKNYHWLEEQHGFPYFNERFEEQNEDIQQTNILDEYTQNYQRHMKTAKDEMDELPVLPPENNTEDIRQE